MCSGFVCCSLATGSPLHRAPASSHETHPCSLCGRQQVQLSYIGRTHVPGSCCSPLSVWWAIVEEQRSICFPESPAFPRRRKWNETNSCFSGQKYVISWQRKLASSNITVGDFDTEGSWRKCLLSGLNWTCVFFWYLAPQMHAKLKSHNTLSGSLCRC